LMASHAHSQVHWTALIQISDLVGEYGVDFVIFLTAACITSAFWNKNFDMPAETNNPQSEISNPQSKFAFHPLALVPAILAPLVIRKPGAALFAEMAAAGVSALLGSQWGPDTLLSGFVQGAAAELVFAFVVYRRWSLPILAVAAVASAAAAWAHDWVIYYADASIELQVVRLAVMAASAIAFAAFGSLALERSLERAGVLQGFGRGPARTGGLAG